MNIKEIQEKAYNTAIQQGLYSENITDDYCISKIIEEVYEMVRAYTNNEIADREYFEFSINRKWFKMPFIKAYKKYVKDSVQDEFADILIMIASFAKHRNIELTREIKTLEWKRNFAKHSIQVNALGFAKNATRTHRKGGIELTLVERLNFLYAYVISWAKTMGIDLDYFVNIKLEYNATRGFKHTN